MPEIAFADLRRILAVRLDNIGDMVLLSPALRALSQAAPNASITLLASPASAQVAPLLPWVSDVIVERAVWQDVGGALPFEPGGFTRLANDLAQKRFDAAFIFTSFSQSPYPPATVCYLAGIPIRAGQSREFGGQTLSYAVKPLPDETYQATRNLHLLRALGIDVKDARLELAVPAEAEASLDQKLDAAGLADGPFVALVPGASCGARRYDFERFMESARLVERETGTRALLLGSKRDMALWPASAVHEVSSLAGETTLPEFAAAIRRSQLVLCNNSSALHFAAAFERPAVVLYAGTDFEEQWLPSTANVRALRRETACSPCYAFDCPYEHECLDIAPEEVAAATMALMSRGVPA